MARASSETPDAASRDPQRVRAMFSRIAPRYDLANHLLSAGADFIWRRRAARIVSRWNPSWILDLATGTGDLTLVLQRRLPKASIIAADFSEKMIELARRKGVQNAIVADALQLPFDAGSFDAVTIAFGLRNMPDWAAALREMRRMLSAEGRLLVLDFSKPIAILQPLYRFYLHQLLPQIASAVTGTGEAYAYLADSIETFPSGLAMLQLIEQCGFRSAEATTLTAGIATIYTATASR
ncbi:MAG: ubiquinone/menaquinone biosynthesis methyltransferase [Chthoniobacterales bacterium]